MLIIVIGPGVLGSQCYSMQSQRHLNEGELAINWQNSNVRCGSNSYWRCNITLVGEIPVMKTLKDNKWIDCRST